MSNIPQEEITGVLERIIYADEETNFCIGELRLDRKNSDEKITITATSPAYNAAKHSSSKEIGPPTLNTENNLKSNNSNHASPPASTVSVNT
jgi:hypothetical protein